MGLDMYAFATAKKNLAEAQVDFELADGVERRDIAYWRKHPNLHGWMEALYREKGGTSADFNCDNVRLEEADLDRLETDLMSGKLPETSGFFFGTSSPEDIAGDMTFVTDARKLLSEGEAVYYSSWW